MLIYNRLSDEQQTEGLNEILENAGDAESGIIRQVLDRGLESLSKKQLLVFTNNIDPLFEEACMVPGCKRSAFVGRAYCDVCGIKYAE